MRLLLDTHTFLWFVWGDAHLSSSARSLIENEAHSKLVSAASVWEMAIKVSLGKLDLKHSIDDFLRAHLDGNGFELLPVVREHACAVATLPYYYRDPFDR